MGEPANFRNCLHGAPLSATLDSTDWHRLPNCKCFVFDSFERLFMSHECAAPNPLVLQVLMGSRIWSLIPRGKSHPSRRCRNTLVDLLLDVGHEHTDWPAPTSRCDRQLGKRFFLACGLLASRNGLFTIAFWFQSGNVNRGQSCILEAFGSGQQWSVIYGYTPQQIEFYDGHSH